MPIDLPPRCFNPERLLSRLLGFIVRLRPFSCRRFIINVVLWPQVSIRLTKGSKYLSYAQTNLSRFTDSRKMSLVSLDQKGAHF